MYSAIVDILKDKLKPCPFCGGEADIEKIPGSPFTNEPYTWGVGCKTCNIGWYEEAKERAIDVWNRRPDMWIPVSERLPEREGEYLVFCEGEDMYNCFYEETVGEFGSYNDCYDPKTFGYVDSVWYKNETVTHWMPLPEGPEKGE
jgi:Lar family restriction alleviation protein